MTKRVSWPPVLEHAAEIVDGYDTGVNLRQLYYRLVADVAPHLLELHRRSWQGNL
jgi:hypothetical protein